MNDNQLHWLAGLIDGEGAFTRSGGSPSVRIKMTDRDTIEKVASLLNAQVLIEKRQPRYKDCYLCVLYGNNAIQLMDKIKPLMSIRRKQRITEIMAWANSRPRSVVRVE